MLNKTLNRYKKLSKPVQNVVWLMWVNSFIGAVMGLFLGLFLFLQTDSIAMLMLFNLLKFLGIVCGFTGWGALLAHLQWGMRLNFLRTFVVSFIAFALLLIGQESTLSLLLFGFLDGFAVGMFWLSIHTYEITLTNNDKERDFYSSIISSGGAFITVLGPLITTISFYLSESIFQVETYTLFFWILLAAHVLYLPFLWGLPEYIPKPIQWGHVKQVLFSRKHKHARQYQYASSVAWPMWGVVVAIIAIISLKTVINIGLLETVIGLSSVFITLAIGHMRHEGNRLSIMRLALVFTIMAYGVLAFYQFTPLAYIVFSLAIVIIGPIFRVSEHMLDLHSIELTQSKDGDFYTGLITREINLSVGRVTAIIALGLVFYLSRSQEVTLYVGIAFMALADTLHYFAGKRMMRSA